MQLCLIFVIKDHIVITMETTNGSYLKSSIKWTVILKTLADETRLQIIHELLKGEASVRDISTALNIKV